jgi:hypothetical protein
MAQFSARSMIDSVAVPAAGTRRLPHELADAAADVAAEPVVSALSPMVVAGAVRMIEMALIVLIGMLIYVGYVVPHDGRQRRLHAA